MVGMATQLTDKVSTGIIYRLERNIQIREDDLPGTGLNEDG